MTYSNAMYGRIFGGTAFGEALHEVVSSTVSDVKKVLKNPLAMAFVVFAFLPDVVDAALPTCKEGQYGNALDAKETGQVMGLPILSWRDECLRAAVTAAGFDATGLTSENAEARLGIEQGSDQGNTIGKATSDCIDKRIANAGWTSLDGPCLKP